MNEEGQVTLTKFRDNLTSIIKHPLITKGHTKVILVAPPPLCMKFQSRIYKDEKVKRIRVAERTRKYIREVRDCAAANDLSLCDTEALLLEEAKSHEHGLSSLYEDGEHL